MATASFVSLHLARFIICGWPGRSIPVGGHGLDMARVQDFGTGVAAVRG